MAYGYIWESDKIIKNEEISMDQERYDNVELSITLLEGLRDTMVSMDSSNPSQVIPVTTLTVFETVIDKIQILLKAATEGV